MTEGGIDAVDSGRPVVIEAGARFMEDRALCLGAGLAYQGLITLAPLPVLMIGVWVLCSGRRRSTASSSRVWSSG